MSGTVVSSEAPAQPVRGAVVTLAGAGANGRSTVTDAQGRFAFAGLPPGRFTITAAKPAHLTNAYGAKGPGRPGTAVAVSAGQSIAGLQFVLPHGAAISGTVRNFSGEPASTTQIVVMRVDPPPVAADMSLPDALTDDRGVYRIFGLSPGTYLVAAVPRPLTGASMINTMSSAEMDAAFREQQTRASGSAVVSPAVAPAVRPVLKSYAPVYYPGTSLSGEAGRITVTSGEDRDGVDVSIALVPVANVEGRVVSAGGPLPEIALTLTTDGPLMRGMLGGGPSLSGTRPGVNGSDSFKFTNVAPGHYTLSARSSNIRTTLSPTGAMQSSARVDASTVPQLWASTEVDVRGDDISGIVLQLQPALSFAGRVVFSGTSLAPPKSLASVTVTLTQDSPMAALQAAMVHKGFLASSEAPMFSGTVKPDGTFQVDSIVPGRYRVTATAPGVSAVGWSLQSVVVASHDVLDTGLDLGVSMVDAVVTFSDRHTEISGALLTSTGQPAPDFAVVVFPANPTLWSTGRRLQSVRPASDGHFTFADLPAGDYLLAALSDDEGWQTPATLQQIAASGVKVTLGDGAKIAQSLKIGRR